MNSKLIFSFVAIVILLLVVLEFTIIINTKSNQASTAKTELNQTPTISEVPIDCSGTSTIQQTEGPYYKAGSPEKTNLYESGIAGTKLTLTGYVLDTNCKPVAGAWLDFWQADGNGNYDNSGYALRGHQFTDSKGKYTLTTVIPGEYPGRTPHIHVKVGKTQNSSITTQLFIPGISTNNTDSIYDESLLMDINGIGDQKEATFNFVLE